MDKNAGTTLRTKLICFIILVLAVAMLPLMAHDLFLAQQNARELVSNMARATLTAAREHIAQHFRQTIAIEAGIILSTKREMRRAAMVAAQTLSFVPPEHLAKAIADIAGQHSSSPIILFHTGRDVVPGPGAEKAEPALLATLTERARSAVILGEPDDVAVPLPVPVPPGTIVPQLAIIIVMATAITEKRNFFIISTFLILSFLHYFILSFLHCTSLNCTLYIVKLYIT